MIGLLVKLVSTRLLKAAGDAFEFIWRNPLPCIIAGLVALSGWLWWQDSRHIEQRDKALAEVAEMKDAIEAADKLAQEEKARKEQRNKELNDEADTRTADTRIVYRDRILRATAPSCSAGKADLPGTVIPEGIDRSGDPPVCISRADALIFADNQSRLEAAHDWAIRLGIH